MSDIVISGLGAVTTFGAGIAALDAGLRAGKTGIRPLGADEFPGLDGLRWGAPAADIQASDLQTRLPEDQAKTAKTTLGGCSRAVRLGLAAAIEAMENAGLPAGVADDRLGLVIAGSNLAMSEVSGASADLAGPRGRPNVRYGYKHLDTVAVGQVSALLGCRGAGMTVGAASASGLAALATAFDMVRAGRLDRCLVLGLPVDYSRAEWLGLELMGAVADERTIGDGPACRPFDAAATGFVPGETAAALVLARAPHPTLATVASVELGLDGSPLPSPDRDGEVAVMRQAIATAGLTSRDIDHVNTHATSTPLGDKTEAEALAEVFDDLTHRPIIAATKGLLGHGLNSAGLVEVVATVLQMRGGYTHANIGLENPIADLRFAGPETGGAAPRVALKTAFGFGGFNAASVLVAP